MLLALLMQLESAAILMAQILLLIVQPLVNVHVKLLLVLAKMEQQESVAGLEETGQRHKHVQVVQLPVLRHAWLLEQHVQVGKPNVVVLPLRMLM